MFDTVRTTMTSEVELRLASNVLGNAPNGIEMNTFSAWQQLTRVALLYKKSLDARKLCVQLEQLLAKSDSETTARFEEVRTWLAYGAIDAFTQGELVRFFSDRKLSFIFGDTDYQDLASRIRSRLLLEFLVDRDVWRESVFKAIRQNSSILTEHFDKAGERGTIMNWLRKYDGEFGMGIRPSIDKERFISEASTAAHLSDSEKLLLRRLVDFYEFIKISSYELEGLEETYAITIDQGRFLIDNGKVVPITFPAEAFPALLSTHTGSRVPPSSALPSQSAAAQPTLATPTVAFARILERSRALLAETDGTAKVVRDALDRALRGKDVETALASLLLLAQLRVLDTLLTDDERFRAMVLDDLKKAGRADTVDGFAINPTAPQFVARFLKIALEDALGLSHEDAIGFGAKLASVLALEGEKYSRIVIDKKWNI